MSREIIDILPFWWIIILSTLLFMLLAYSSTRISARFFSIGADYEQQKQSTNLISILSGGFTILLAFIIINTWNYQMEARLSTLKEADSLSLMLHDMAMIKTDERVKMKKAVRDYTVAVRVKEWKEMRKGYSSLKAWAALDNLFTTLEDYHPHTKQEKRYYTRLITNMNELLQARRARLNRVASILPPPLRTSLILSAMVLIMILGLIRGESKLFYVMPLIVFAGILGFNLGLALCFDYPYSGEIAISNQPFYSGILAQLPDD